MGTKNTSRTAPVVAVNRLRMGTDGKGVTALVGFYGCPLRCKWCLNPSTWAPDTPVRHLSPEELYTQVRRDALYYLATGGGVTFGGGEPLLHAWFLVEFRSLCGGSWHLCAETSLAVPWEQVRMAAECIDEFIVDCKDTEADIYRRYTGGDNALVLENLRRLVLLVGTERILVRVPLIPEFNTEEHRLRSVERLREMGLTRFDLFTYQCP